MSFEMRKIVLKGFMAFLIDYVCMLIDYVFYNR